MKSAFKPTPGAAVAIRTATKSDVAYILSFIRELAEFEKLSHEVMASEETLVHHLFGATPRGECLIAEVDGAPAGFALFFHNFSTFLGKPGLYLEDLYVKPDYRSSGIGKRLLQELGKIALARDCGRMEWSVLNWNQPAIDFYRKIGAKPMSEWTVQRLGHDEMEALAKG